MDKPRQPAKLGQFGETAILRAALKALGEYGLAARIERLEPDRARGAKPDAIVQLTIAGKRVPYAVDIKRWLTPATLGNAVAGLRGLGENTLLITDYATQPVAKKLKELDVAFADAAGNAYIHHPPVLVWVTGRKPTVTVRPPRAGRAFQPAGLQLIFALLCKPDLLGEPFREIAAYAGVAHGTVGWVMEELRALGYLVELRPRARVRRLRNRRKLLAQWADAYARTLRPQLLVGQYQAPDAEWWRKIDLTRYTALLGAEPAAAIATGYLRPGVVTLYVKDKAARLIAKQRLRKTPDGNVEIRRKFWPFDYEWEYPALTPPVLIYADLLATGDARCVEAAQRLYDTKLARLFTED